MTTNDGENKTIIGKQPDFSWQVNPNRSKQCSTCGGTGRMKKDAPDPGSLLEWQNKELLRKLHRCHEAIRFGMYAIQGLIRTRADGKRCHPTLTQMVDALTDRGEANPDE